MRAKVCKIEGCGKPLHGSTWCGMHYRRNLYRGSPTAPNLKEDPERNFWSHVDKAGPVPSHRPELGPCWLWTAAIATGGYGKWGPPKGFPIQSYQAHRVSYSLQVGPIPEDKPHLDHLCRVRPCVRPEHLEPVTLVENLRRGRALITHCPAGHVYDEANTLHKGNSRNCRTCHRDRERERRRIAHEHGGG